jgi:hypothetical protein
LDSHTQEILARGHLEETEAKFDIFAMMKEEEEDPILKGHADYVSPGNCATPSPFPPFFSSLLSPLLEDVAKKENMSFLLW